MTETNFLWPLAGGLLIGLSAGLYLLTTGRIAGISGLTASAPLLVVAGLIVGFGTRLGSGCTSGHGVCGLARLSPRSLVSTLTFMAIAALTVLAVRLVGGGAA